MTIGFNAVPALLSHRVAAATAFWNDEGVALQRRRPGFHSFRVDAYGAPPYPELVLVATRSTLQPTTGHRPRDRPHARPRLRCHPHRSRGKDSADLEQSVKGLDPTLVSAELSAEEPAFLAPDGNFGELTLSTLTAWSRWEARFGIVKRPPNVLQTFDPRFVAGTQSLIGN